MKKEIEFAGENCLELTTMMKDEVTSLECYKQVRSSRHKKIGQWQLDFLLHVVKVSDIK